MTKINEIERFCRNCKNLRVHLLSSYASDLSKKRMTDDQIVSKFHSRVRSELKRALTTFRYLDDDDARLARAFDDLTALRALDDFITRLIRQGEYAINHR